MLLSNGLLLAGVILKMAGDPKVAIVEISSTLRGGSVSRWDMRGHVLNGATVADPKTTPDQVPVAPGCRAVRIIAKMRLASSPVSMAIAWLELPGGRQTRGTCQWMTDSLETTAVARFEVPDDSTKGQLHLAFVLGAYERVADEHIVGAASDKVIRLPSSGATYSNGPADFYGYPLSTNALASSYVQGIATLTGGLRIDCYSEPSIPPLSQHRKRYLRFLVPKGQLPTELSIERKRVEDLLAGNVPLSPNP